MQKSLMNVLNTRMIADSLKWMYFRVNEITIRVNESIFSVNEQQKVSKGRYQLKHEQAQINDIETHDTNPVLSIVCQHF